MPDNRPLPPPVEALNTEDHALVPPDSSLDDNVPYDRPPGDVDLNDPPWNDEPRKKPPAPKRPNPDS